MNDRKEGEAAGMFRLKKPADNGADNGSDMALGPDLDPRTDPGSEPLAAAAGAVAGEAKPPVRRPPAPPLRSLVQPAALDLSRRPGEIAGPTARADTQLPAVREKTLLVGREVELSGEIKACHKLIVEGVVQISSASCRQLQVSPTGIYRGQIEVAEAEILGRFEGDLVARDRLIVRASGRVSGKIRYGSIIVDAGGEIVGEISAIGAAGDAAGAPQPQAPGSDGSDGGRQPTVPAP
jgi:cytoskeletal protein CcmA (bactofilin family)